MKTAKSGLWPCVLMCMASVWTSASAATDAGRVVSPDGRNVVEISVDDQGVPCYRVLRDGRELVAPSKMGLRTGAADFTAGVTFMTSQDGSIDETYAMPTGKFSVQRNRCNETRFTFGKDDATLDVVVRSYDDGVAYRYELPGEGSAEVLAEQSEVRIPSFTTCWGERYVADYSTQYPARDWEATAAIENGRMCAPVLVRTSLGDDAYVMITEAAVNGDYHASSLFAGTADDKGLFTFGNPDRVTVALPFASPWRTLYAGSLASMVESNLVDNLNPATSMDDLSWIKPGLSSWDWGGLDGSQCRDFDTVKHFIDQAAVMGWDYFTLDEGWDYSTYRLKDVTDYAAERGVRVFIWSHQNRFTNDEEQMREIFSNWAALGFAGVKIDFFENDSKDFMEKYETMLKVCAECRLMVNFHGCTKPSGLRRTYPHLVTSEAVYGGEQYFFNHLATPADHNVTLALTRNVIGAMDYTPTEFARKDGVIRHTTTWAHQVALATIYESGVQTMSDYPENMIYNASAPLLKVLPAAWDETRCIEAEPDSHISMARRSGDDWYVAGISKDARTMTVTLDFITAPCTAQIYKDGTCPSDIAYEERTVSPGDELTVDVKATGGFTVHLSQTPHHQPARLLIEAESGRLIGQATVDDDSRGNCSGGKMAGFLGNGQGSLECTAAVEADGLYDITFFYVTQDTRSMEVSVNGGEYARKYEFPGNGFSWASDGLAVKTVTVPLKAGENTLTLGNPDGWCPNIDRMEVAPSLGLKDVRVESIGAYSDGSPVTAVFRNGSDIDLEDVTVAWQLDGGDKCTGHIALKAGESKSHTFSDMPASAGEGNHVLQVTVEPSVGVTGDMVSTSFCVLPDEDGSAVSLASRGGRIESYSAQVNDGEGAAKLLDGDASTKWCDNATDRPWAVVELPEKCYVDKFVIRDCRTREEQFKNVDQYRISVSEDGTDWHTVVDAKNRKTDDIKVDNIAPVEARYVKLEVKRPAADTATRIYGFDVYKTSQSGTESALASASEAPQSFAHRGDTIALNNASRGQLAVYKTDGALVNRRFVEPQGTLVCDFPAGLYIVSLICDGARNAWRLTVK